MASRWKQSHPVGVSTTRDISGPRDFVRAKNQSGSDCEILLPLYREYGLEMFARLDAEFALVLYDGVSTTRDISGPRDFVRAKKG